jgi:hypothetical protein
MSGTSYRCSKELLIELIDLEYMIIFWDLMGFIMCSIQIIKIIKFTINNILICIEDIERFINDVKQKFS